MTAAPGWRYRGAVAARAVAAIGGGYLLAAASTALLAKLCTRLLDLQRADAVTLSTMLAFVVYPCAVMWVFATTSARRAWAGIVLATALCGVLLWTMERSA